MKEYYEILGLPTNASKEDIKKSYRKLSSKVHPDKGGNEYLFNQVKDAYDILMGNKTQEIVPVQKNVFEPFSMLQGPSHGLFSSMNQLFDTSLDTDKHLFSNKRLTNMKPNTFYSESSVTTIKNGEKKTKKKINDNGKIYTFYD